MTHIDTLFPSKYLTASDLNDQVVTVTIVKVTIEEVGEEKDERPILYFDGMPKGLVLNKTNARRIAGLYGPEIEQWSGKAIMLYPAETEYQGRDVECIRVKKDVPPVAPTTAPQPEQPVGVDEMLAAMTPEQRAAIAAALVPNAGLRRE